MSDRHHCYFLTQSPKQQLSHWLCNYQSRTASECSLKLLQCLIQYPHDQLLNMQQQQQQQKPPNPTSFTYDPQLSSLKKSKNVAVKSDLMYGWYERLWLRSLHVVSYIIQVFATQNSQPPIHDFHRFICYSYGSQNVSMDVLEQWPT